MTTRNRTCADRIGEHLESRLSHLGALSDLAGVHDGASFAEVLEDRATRDQLRELTPGGSLFDHEITAALRAADAGEPLEEELPDRALEEIRESADTAMLEVPLSVEAVRTFKVLLSWGGPSDWLEVVCSGDTPVYEGTGEPYEITRIVYHFADWFDHAEEELTGRHLEVAEEFARRVVPELAG